MPRNNALKDRLDELFSHITGSEQVSIAQEAPKNRPRRQTSKYLSDNINRDGRFQISAGNGANGLSYENSFSVEVDNSTTVGSLDLQNFRVDLNAESSLVDSAFRENQGLVGVILCDKDIIQGIISRRKFYEHLGKQFGVSIFLKRPILVMLESIQTKALTVPATCAIAETVRLALDRPTDQIFEPVLVEFAAGDASLLDIYTLLLAQTKLLAALQQQIVKDNAELEQRVQSRSAELLKVNANLELQIFERRLAEERLQVRLRYEKTLNQCAAVLLTSGESHGIIQKTLTYLISAVEVSRVFVLETIAGSDSHPDLRLRNQVYATNLSPIPEQLSFFSVEELGAWLRILWSGKPITSQISDAAPDESALLEKFGITSILLIPIGQVGNWIGVIGFGETKTERIWDDYDIQLLYTVAQMLYAYLERRQSALELARAHDKAVKANLFKSELLAKVSHELRTPLGAVLGYTQLLHYGSYGDLTNEQKSIAQVVIDSTKYLATLVNGILDQAQLDKGQLVINKAPFQVREMVKEVENRMRFLAENKGLEFIVIVEPSTPNEITGDRVRIEQILTNLLGNAIKFTEEGYVKLRIASPSNAILLFEVSDTGVGIPEKEHSRIFDPFTQVDGSLTRRHDGTGLGLSITKQLIEMMKGLITLNSQVGKGSTFTVEIPL